LDDQMIMIDVLVCTGMYWSLENEAVKEEAIKEDYPVQLGSYNLVLVLVMRIVEA